MNTESTPTAPGALDRATADFYRLTPMQQDVALKVLARNALPLFGIEQTSELDLLGHRENSVYRLRTHKGEQYALRIHRSGYHSEQAVQSELQWMTALNESGVKCPPVLRSKHGRLVEWVAFDTVPEPRMVDIFHWVDGGPPAESDIISTYETLGQITAKIHNQAIAWERPTSFERLVWNEDGMLGHNPLWGYFGDLEQLTEEQRSLLIAARDKAYEMLVAFGKSGENYGLIHADLMPENIMVADDGTVRVIDFDDSGFGWHMYDLATATLFHIGEDHFDDLVANWVKGYRSERNLPDEHLAMLPTFLMTRTLVALGWAHTRKETETAIAMTDDVIALGCHLAEEYLG